MYEPRTTRYPQQDGERREKYCKQCIGSEPRRNLCEQLLLLQSKVLHELRIGVTVPDVYVVY